MKSSNIPGRSSETLMHFKISNRGSSDTFVAAWFGSVKVFEWEVPQRAKKISHGESALGLFLRLYEGCSLENFLYLLLNPRGAFHVIFSGSKNRESKVLKCLPSAIERLVSSAISHPCFQDPDFQQALRAFANFEQGRFSYLSPESKPSFEMNALRLMTTTRSSDEGEKPSVFELITSPIVEFMKIQNLPDVLKCKILGFLNVPDFLGRFPIFDLMRFWDSSAESDQFRRTLNHFLHVVRGVLYSENPRRQADLLYDLFSYLFLGIDDRNMIMLAVLHPPLAPGAVMSNPHNMSRPTKMKEGFQPYGVFFIRAMRLLFNLPEKRCPDRDSLIQQVMTGVEAFFTGFRDRVSRLLPGRDRIVPLVSFSKACVQSLKKIGARFSIKRLKKFKVAESDQVLTLITIFVMNAVAPSNYQRNPGLDCLQFLRDMRGFIAAWLCDVDEERRREIFNQFALRPIIRRFFPNFSFKKNNLSELSKQEGAALYDQLLSDSLKAPKSFEKLQEVLRVIEANVRAAALK